MSATDMPDLPPTYKGRPWDENLFVARETEPRATDAGAQSGEMLSHHTSKSAAVLAGLLAPSADDVLPPTEAVWWASDISHPAKLLAIWLAEAACPLSGEAIVDLYDAVYFGNFTDKEDFAEAAGELVHAGVLEYCRALHGRVMARFPTEEDGYYGTDETLPADWGAPFNDFDDYRFEAQIAEVSRPNVADPRRKRIYDKTEGRCFYCITAWAEHLDHMHPKSRDGCDADENLIGACSSCNSQKRDRTVEEYRALLAYQRRLPDIRLVCFYGEAAQ